jgi:hypothetical protein
MIRLRRDDFQDPHELAKLGATCKLTPEEFRREFEYLVEDEPPALVLDEGQEGEPSRTAADAGARPSRRSRRSAR